MSDTSSTRAVPPSPRPAPTGAPADALPRAVLPLLAAWLPRQRWFAGKGRPIAGLRVLAATPLAAAEPGAPAVLHLLLAVEQTGNDTDCYQLLLGTRADPPAALTEPPLGRIDGGPHDGLLVYDALHDPEPATRLLALLSAGGQLGGLRFHRCPGATVPVRGPVRVGTAEQSNTSVVYGDALILKVFRRVSAGVNPDLELSRALHGAGSTRVPAPLAWFDTRWPGPDGGDVVTLGLLQRFLPGAVDGWDLALRSVPHQDFTAESFLLGVATAEVHTVLARALPRTTLDAPLIDALATRMADRLDAAARAVPALTPYRRSLRTAFADLADLGRGGRRLTAQRVHGDLHLGQALRTTEGWVLLDFEGEPARPLAERRRPQPAVRDVAAILRSFDYAARHHGAGAAADLWAEHNRAAFCAGYAAVGDQDPAAERVLMRAFETDKAVYEVLYEARNRPDWLPIPMSAVRRLATPAG